MTRAVHAVNSGHASALARAMVMAAALALGGCAGVAVGAGATTGVAALQERGLEVAARDTRLEAEIIAQWLTQNDKLVIDIDVEVYEGRALLTGAVDGEAVRADAVRMAWKVAGIKDVLNEIQIVADSDLIDLARDTWITTQLKSKLTFDQDVLAINYAIETVNGVVYLIGIAQNQAELERVVGHARDIEYVGNVISHVRVKGAS
ncbi:MAG: BON domain-containing protein [Rhodospirillales bacterium]|jgi:osmotically-inducible protein OsmY|nr:BON domain-containing protein [Rhodospirillales bacterium]